MKLKRPIYFLISSYVTPFVGVWIETLALPKETKASVVTPFVGVWIETSFVETVLKPDGLSHPSWVCGLKPQKCKNAAH